MVSNKGESVLVEFGAVMVALGRTLVSILEAL